MRTPRSFRRATAVATALLALAALVPVTPASAAGAGEPVIWVRAAIGSCDYRGFAGNAGNVIKIEHRAADGTLRKRHTLQIQPGGLWSVACPGPTLAGGDKLLAYSQSGQTLLRTVTIPRLKLALDRVGDTGTGRYPGGADQVTLSRGFCDVATFTCDAETIDEVTPPTGGPLSLDGPIDAADWAQIVWYRGDDRFERVAFAARLVVRPGTSKVRALGGSFGETVSFTLRRGTLIGRGSAKTGPDSVARATIRRNGSPMTIKVGDVIVASVASDAKLTVPPFNLYPTEGAINGRCFKGGSVMYRITDADGMYVSDGTATAYPEDGSWSHPEDGLASGNKVVASCANAKGDVLELQMILP